MGRHSVNAPVVGVWLQVKPLIGQQMFSDY